MATNNIQLIKEATGLRLDEMGGKIAESEALLESLYARRAELETENTGLRKRLIDLQEQYLARDVSILNRLGLKWPPDTTFAEILATAWEMRRGQTGHLIYLASPYFDQAHHVRQYRADVTMSAVFHLILDSHFIYSPVLHWTPTAERCGVPISWDHWRKFDELMIERSDELWVLAIEGWLESANVQADVELARRQGKTVKLVQQTPDGWEVGPEVWDVANGKIIGPSPVKSLLKKLIEDQQ